MIATQPERKFQAATTPSAIDALATMLDGYAVRPDRINKLALLNHFNMMVRAKDGRSVAVAERELESLDEQALPHATAAFAGLLAIYAERPDRISKQVLLNHVSKAVADAGEAPQSGDAEAGATPAFLTVGDHAMLARYAAVEQHGLSRSNLSRLAEIGVLRHIGLGAYAVSTFGFYVLGREFVTLPLKPVVEYRR